MAHSNKYLLSVIVDVIKVILPDSHSHHSEISQAKARLREVMRAARANASIMSAAAPQTRQEGHWTPQGYVGTADAPAPSVTLPEAPVSNAPGWVQKAKEAQEEWAKWREHDAAVIAAGHPQVEPTKVPVASSDSDGDFVPHIRIPDRY